MINSVGIVFASSVSKSASQISFAKQIIDKIGIDKIKVVSGSSLGSLNAYVVGTNSYNELVNFYSTFGYKNILSFNKKARKELTMSLLSSIGENKLVVPTYVSTTKLFSFNCNYFCLNEMSNAHQRALMKLSCGYPFIKGPQLFNHSLWASGFYSDSYPILPLTYYDLDMIIILHSNPKYYPPEELYKRVKPGTIIIDIDTSLNLPKGITAISTSKEAFQDMVHVGEIEGKIFVDEIFSDFDKDNVRERSYVYTLEHMSQRSNKNPDVFTNCLNALNILYNMKEYVI